MESGKSLEELSEKIKKDSEGLNNALNQFSDNVNRMCIETKLNLSNGEIYDHRKCVRSDYASQFSVFLKNVYGQFYFTFCYTELTDHVKMLGGISYSSYDHCVDDDDDEAYCANEAKRALQIAINHLEKKFSKKVLVKPKEYRIGAYEAWSIK